MTNQTPESVIAEVLDDERYYDRTQISNDSRATEIVTALRAANMLREPGVPDAATGRFECDRECIGEGAPVEDCSAHGRTQRDLWEQIDKVVAERDAATAEAKKQLGEIQRHFTAIAGSGEIRVYEDTGEKHGIDYQSSVWAKRGERMTRDLIEFLGEHHRPEPVGNGESK